MSVNLVLAVCVLLIICTIGIAVVAKVGMSRLKINLSVAWIPYVLAIGLFVFTVCFTRKSIVIVFIALISLLLLILLKNQSVITKSLFAHMGVVSASLLVVLSMIIMVNAAILSIWEDTSNREELTVETTMPYKTQIISTTLPSEVNNRSLYHKHWYINPIDGVMLNGKRTYPLIYSTDLNRYGKYCISGDAISNDSVIIGHVLARKADAKVGSEITINGKRLHVTHIAETEQYAGMMIYISDSTFKKVFGMTGNVFYGTDLSGNEVKKHFKTNKIQTRADYRKYYRNSMSQIILTLYSIDFLILLVGVFIAYKIFAIFINFIIWKLNMLRGFGMSFKEYAKAVSLQYLAIIGSAFYVVVVVFDRFSGLLTDLIFNTTDSYFPITYNLFFFVITMIEFLFVIGIVILLSYKNICKESIYQQYLHTSSER